MSFSAIFDVDFCVRAVQTLAHFLWQGLLIAVVVAAVNRLAGRRSAAVRYGVAFATLLLMASCLPVTFVLLPNTESEPANMAERPEENQVVSTVDTRRRDQMPKMAVPAVTPGAINDIDLRDAPEIETVTATGPTTPADEPDAWHRLSPLIVGVYFLGVLVMLGRLSIALGGGQRLRRRAVPVSDPTLLDVVARKAAEFGLRAAPAVAEWERIAVPIIVGVIRPVILLPGSILTQLSPAQVEAVLAHELAHIRRWDHVANFVQRVIESLLFYHPAVWYVSRCVSRERENCCDDVVVAHGAEPAAYAELLVRVSELGQKWKRPPAATLAASGSKPTRLRQRIVRLLEQTTETPMRVSRASFALSTITVLSIVVAMLYIRSHAASSPNDESTDFIKAHIFYLTEGADHYRKIEVGSTGRTYKTLVGFFPQVGERKPGGDEAGWSAPLIVEFERRDRTRHRLTCDLTRFWNEGNGDRLLHDADGLTRFLKEAYYPRRYTSWVEFVGDGWVELQAICRAPFGRDRWWGPDGIGCGFNPDDRERNARAGEYMICIRDSGPEGARMYSIPGALVVNPHDRPDSTLIQFQPSDEAAETATLRLGIAHGLWQTVVKTAGPEKIEHELGTIEVTSATINGTRGSISALIPIALNQLNWDLVAVDRQGKAHHNDGEDVTDVAQPGVVLEEYEFDLGGAEIRHFELRTRPFQFVEFQNIRLKPNDDAEGEQPVPHRADFGRTGNYRATGAPRLAQVSQVFDHASENTAAFVVADGVAYFVGTDAERKAHVWAVDRKTGKQLWSVPTPGDRYVFTAPLVHDGRVYFGGPDAKLRCADAKTGAIHWKTQFDATVDAAPVAAGGMIVVSVGGTGFGIEAKTGKVRWEIEGCHHAPATVVGDSVFLLGCRGLLAADVRSGEVKWQGDGISGPAEGPCDLVVAGGRVFVCTIRRARAGTQNLRRDLIAFSAIDGKRLWRSEGESEPIWELTPEPAGRSSGIAVSGNIVTHTSYGGFVYGIDVRSGERIWHRDFERPLSTPPSIGGSLVYFASYNGTVTALDLTTGRTVWEHQLPDRVHTAPIVIDGGLLVMDRQARLHQFVAAAEESGDQEVDVSASPPDPARHPHLTRLHGLWKIVAAEPGGVEFSGASRKDGERIHIQLVGPSTIEELDRDPLRSVAEHTWLQEQRHGWELALAIDPKAGPSAFNVAFSDSDRSRVHLGRYELDGDELNVRFGPPDGARPQNLDFVQGDKGGLLKLQRDTTRLKLIGTWSGGGLIPIRLVFRDDGTFEQSYDVPDDKFEKKPESGTWELDKETLTREVTKTEDKDRVGLNLVREIVQLDDKLLRLKTKDDAFATYHRARVFHGWTLLSMYSTTDTSKLPDLFEERPPGSKSYEIRRDVMVAYQGLDGTVYHRPDKKVFYTQSDPIGASTQTFYGPYKGDPRELLSLPKDRKPAADTTPDADANAWGPPVDGVQVGLFASDGRNTVRHDGTKLLVARTRRIADKELIVVAHPRLGCRLEVDGQWYRWNGADRELGVKYLRSSDYKKDGLEIPIDVPRDETWRDADDADLVLIPGRHIVRLSWPAFNPLETDPLSPDPDRLVQLITNRIALEVPADAEGDQPAKVRDADAAWGKAVEGVQVRARLTIDRDSKKRSLSVDIRNVGKEDRWVSPQIGDLLVSTWHLQQSPGDDLPFSSHIYEGGRRILEDGRVLEPGESLHGQRIPLDESWTRPERPAYEVGGTPKRIALEWPEFGTSAVQYYLRVYRANAEGNPISPDKPDGIDAAAASNRVWVLPRAAEENPDGAAWHEAPGGVQAGLRVKKIGGSFGPFFRFGDRVQFEVLVRNTNEHSVTLQVIDGTGQPLVNGDRIDLQPGIVGSGEIFENVFQIQAGATEVFKSVEHTLRAKNGKDDEPTTFRVSATFQSNSFLDNDGKKRDAKDLWTGVLQTGTLMLRVEPALNAATLVRPFKEQPKSDGDEDNDDRGVDEAPPRGKQSLLWPPELNDDRFVGAWHRPNASDREHIVLLLNNDSSWVEAAVQGEIDDLKSADHILRSPTWRLQFENPRDALVISTYSVVLGEKEDLPDGGSSSPRSMSIESVTDAHFFADSGFDGMFPGMKYRRANAKLSARLCELLNVDVAKTRAAEPNRQRSDWPCALNPAHVVGTWILRGGDDQGRDVFSLRDDGTWWKATIAGTLAEPARIVDRRKVNGPWQIKQRDGRCYLQFGDPIRQTDGGTAMPDTLSLTAVWTDRLIGGTYFRSVVVQPVFDRATTAQAERFEGLFK